MYVSGRPWAHGVRAFSSGCWWQRAASSLPLERPAAGTSLTFEPVQELQPLDSDPEAVAIGDVTGDRRKDVVMTHGRLRRTRSTTGRSCSTASCRTATLAAPEAFLPVWKVAVHGVALGDVDGDRRNDVVVATDLGVNVFRQRGGTLSRPFVVPYTVGGYAVDIADMNRDGREDIVVRGGTWVRIARNLRGGFRGSIVARGRNQDVEAGDVNGDRRPDLVAASYQGRLRVYRQRRNGTFSRARIQRTRRGASGVAVADLRATAAWTWPPPTAARSRCSPRRRMGGSVRCR